MPSPSSRIAGPATAARTAAVAALLTLLPLVAGCSLVHSGSGDAVLAQPAALWATPAQYEGRLVRTTGVVQGFQLGTAGEHYVVEDSAPHRVELLGVAHTRLAAMAGHTVIVVGRFHFSGTQGYTLDVQSIEVAG